MKQSLDYHDLQVFLTEYKIDLFRYDAYVRSVVLSKMNNAQKDILATIVKQDVSNLTKREVDFLLRKIEKTIEEEYERIDSFLDKTYKELYITSSQIELFAYNSWLGTDLFKNLPKYKLEAIKTTPLFQGRDISDFWSRQKDSLKFNIETAIRNGAMIGDSEFNVAREIRDRFEIAGREATTLVRTANASISNQAQAHLIDLNSDILYGKQHVSTLDSRTCFASGTNVLTPDGSVPIDKLKAGDFVVGGLSGEPREVLGTASSKVERVLRLTLDNGEVIICTPDHLFLTKDGWIEAEMLEGRDIIEPTNQ